MRLSTFVMCLSSVPRQVEIIFAGMAEPWLNPHCTDMVMTAVDFGYRVGVYSTLSGLQPEHVDSLSTVPFLHFCIHLPDSDGRMKLQITPDYLRTLELCAKHIPNRNFVVYGKLHPDVKAIVGDIPDSTPGLISRASNLPTLAIKPKTGRLKCSACGPNLDHNVLLPNGDVALCCMDYGLDHIIGNLVTMDYTELFRTKAYLDTMRALEDETIPSRCRQCEISVPT